jgi:hypothetical protein
MATKAQKRIDRLDEFAHELAVSCINGNLTSVRDTILSYPKTFAVLLCLEVASLLSGADRDRLATLLRNHVLGGY